MFTKYRQYGGYITRVQMRGDNLLKIRGTSQYKDRKPFYIKKEVLDKILEKGKKDTEFLLEFFRKYSKIMKK